jgi:Tetratrico peptide repeat
MHSRRTNVPNAKRSLALLEELLVEKSATLSQAQTLTAMGMGRSAQPLWAAAAALEERIAPLLDASGDDLEAAVHRISAASCYEKAGDPSRATNLYRAALAGPLRDVTRKEVEEMLAACLARLKASPPHTKAGKVASAS